MNALEKHLNEIDPGLYSKFIDTKKEVELLLQKYSSNFPTYTDHSIKHTTEVFQIASEILTDEELNALNADELYVLSVACILHDIGMCIPEEKIELIAETEGILSYRKSQPSLSLEDFIREIHHQLSHKLIITEWEFLKLASKKYAKAIALVAEGHRKVDLGNFDTYEPQYFCKTGKDFVCLPYLACILRIADELDVTNSRTPKLLAKYYMPNNEKSIREWAKHMATSQRNYLPGKVLFEVDCSDQQIYAALQEQFDKIQNVITYCQKIIRSIPFIKPGHYTLLLSIVEVKYDFLGFHPKGIRFSFNVQNVVTTFIGEDLYNNKFTSIREAVQNAIDSCRYKSKVLKETYNPLIRIFVNSDSIVIEDNGAGMDEFIIENFFARLGSSFYEQEKIKSQFEAIGQFGVGVFSYFLLSEYIDIETQTSTTPALKFRFDKDPKSYFHFYEKTGRNEPGTTTTMYLKSNLIGSVSQNEVEKYIRSIFKHIEIAIEIVDRESKILLEGQPFEINPLTEIKERVKLQYNKLCGQMELKIKKIDNENLEGICGLIVFKNYLKTFSGTTILFDDDQFSSISRKHLYSEISFCQKGVFVNCYSGVHLNLVIGDINLKKKFKINVDRNRFSDEKQIMPVIESFELEILKELFNSLESKYASSEERITITNDFLENYSSITSEFTPSDSYINLLSQSLYFRCYNNGNSSTFNILTIISEFDEFILISDQENAERISNTLRKPIVIAKGRSYDGTYDDVVSFFNSLLGYSQFLMASGDHNYILLRKMTNEEFRIGLKKIKDLIGYEYDLIAESNSDKIYVSVWKNKHEFKDTSYGEDGYINYNHPFIKYVLSNYDELASNVSHRKIIKSAFSLLREYSDEIRSPFKQLNEVLQPLRKGSNLKKFTVNDFA